MIGLSRPHSLAATGLVLVALFAAGCSDADPDGESIPSSSATPGSTTSGGAETATSGLDRATGVCQFGSMPSAWRISWADGVRGS